MPRRQGGSGRPLSGLREAFDEARFGKSRTLNLRESLPTAAEAVARAEAWLRQQQVQQSGGGDTPTEVLVITGRGNNSEGGVSVVRSAIEGLIHRLKQRGVVQRHEEHTAGSFVVTLAPVRELWSTAAPKGKIPEPPPPDPPSLEPLDRETRLLLRQLAERSLEQLGVRGDRDRFIEGEMVRQFSALSATLAATGSGDREKFLRAAIRRALEEYD